MTAITVDFDLLNLTKGAARYTEREQSKQVYIGTLYVRKTTFEGAPPEALTVTVEWE